MVVFDSTYVQYRLDEFSETECSGKSVVFPNFHRQLDKGCKANLNVPTQKSFTWIPDLQTMRALIGLDDTDEITVHSRITAHLYSGEAYRISC